ncbi:Ldh family oxidoreductase [Leisingera sp. M658]|uniref:Ldh family oxidoreductase n=1 Tax=Leisingera sp. M658 TaxID=2867015 RepID=UPI0021A26E62|nr:Ldh family oxidoreductase [Leisingera sp. M658]UWQ75815.1 Ldh family oxidoreductase [Leisingera sp. M658]
MSKPLFQTEIQGISQACLLRNGCDAENAQAIAGNIAKAELDGCHSHGMFRLPGYVAALKSGKANGTARPEITAGPLGSAVIQVNGCGGFAPLALQQTQAALIEHAQSIGVAVMALTNVHHFSALWADVEPLARQGCVALACTAYLPAVAPAGSQEPFFGTNPMAFAWPRKDKPPLVIDQSSAAMARGEVMIAARDGKPLPPGVGLDQDGNATTDAAEVLKGVMLPFGGHKGSSIALMIELLAAGLIGEAFSVEAKRRDNGDGGPPRGGMFFLAMDPSRFGDAAWGSHSDSFLEELAGVDGARLPGDRRYQARAKNRNQGVCVPQSLLEKITQL